MKEELESVEMCCLNCKKYTGNENSNVWKAKQNRLMFLPNFAICGK